MTFTRLISCLLLFLSAGCASDPPDASVLDGLQGSWEGEGPPGELSITITGNALHYVTQTDSWFETTFTLPARTAPGSAPQQLHATIKDSSTPESGIGDVVFAIMKIEDGTLTLAVDNGSDTPPTSFADASSVYVLRKVQEDRDTGGR